MNPYVSGSVPVGLCSDPLPEPTMNIVCCKNGHIFGALSNHPKDNDGLFYCPHCLVNAINDVSIILTVG